MEARLSVLHNEHSILAALVCCTNTRLLGSWHHEWQPPYELGAQIHVIMVRIFLGLPIPDPPPPSIRTAGTLQGW